MPGPAGPYLSMAVFNALVPKEGPKAIPITFDFSLSQSFSADFTIAQQTGQISVIQLLFVDNSANAKSLIVTVPALGQNLIVPPLSQGYFPILSPNQPKFILSSTGGVAVTVFFINVPMPAIEWNSSGTFQFDAAGELKVSDAALEALISSGALQVTPPPANVTDASVAATGASQVVLAANPARKGFQIQISGHAWALNPNGAAALNTAGSLTFASLDIYTSPEGGAATGAIAVIGTVADPITVKEW